MAVAHEAETPPRDALTFSFDVPAFVERAFPSEGPTDGGALVFVNGVHLRPGEGRIAPSCAFGDEPSRGGAPAFVVSSALMVCETPARARGLVEVAASVSDMGETYSDTNVRHVFVPFLHVTDSFPPSGPEAGGTSILLNGRKFRGWKVPRVPVRHDVPGRRDVRRRRAHRMRRARAHRDPRCP